VNVRFIVICFASQSAKCHACTYNIIHHFTGHRSNVFNHFDMFRVQVSILRGYGSLVFLQGNSTNVIILFFRDGRWIHSDHAKGRCRRFGCCQSGRQHWKGPDSPVQTSSWQHWHTKAKAGTHGDGWKAGNDENEKKIKWAKLKDLKVYIDGSIDRLRAWTTMNKIYETMFCSSRWWCDGDGRWLRCMDFGRIATHHLCEKE